MQRHYKTRKRFIVGYRRLFEFLSCVALLAGLSGCASTGTNGLHLYNSENDAKASAAKEAADKLNLADRIKTERENQAKILAWELSIVEDFSIVRRDSAIRSLLEPRYKAVNCQCIVFDHVKAMALQYISRFVAMQESEKRKQLARTGCQS